MRWDSQRTDWYAGFAAAGPWLESGAEAGSPPQKSLTTAAWFALTGDAPEACVGTVRFRDPPASASARKLAGVEATQLVVEAVDVPNATPSDAGAQYAAMAAPMPSTPR